MKQHTRIYKSQSLPFEGSFPAVKKMKLNCDERTAVNNWFGSYFIADRVKMLPGLERLEISGFNTPLYMKVIAKGIAEAANLKELDLALGRNYKRWLKKEHIGRLPSQLRCGFFLVVTFFIID